MASPAFTHVEGSLPFYYMRRAVSIKRPPFVFALFTVLDSKEPLVLAPQMTRHNYSTVETTGEEQQLPK